MGSWGWAQTDGGKCFPEEPMWEAFVAKVFTAHLLPDSYRRTINLLAAQGLNQK